MSLLPLLLLAVPFAEPQAWHRYDIRVDAALSALDVRACFADGLPDRLVANHPLARETTRAFHYLVDGRETSHAVHANVVALPRPSDDGCISWRAELAPVRNAKRWNLGYQTGNTLILAPGTWLWRPPVLTAHRDIEFRFHLPEGIHVSVPWLSLKPEESSVHRFRYGRTPLRWSSLMAIGHLEVRAFEVPGARFRLAIADGEKVDVERVMRWMQSAALAVTQLWGRYPVPDVQLLVVPVAEGYDAAPWAQTNRGGGAAAHFFMNTNADESVFRDDWIATHELAHFALPYVRRSDSWLSEGFASYYQNVLRARAGMITPREAWQALHDGFLRGHRNTGHDTLRDDARHMQARGRAMRVYWSGAAIALLADVELRRRTDGEWSLDQVLAVFDRCCRYPERSWTDRELFAKFDDISNTTVFDTLYRNNVYSRHFPRLAETLHALGVEVDGDGQVSLEDEPALEGIRAGIMAAPPGAFR